MKKIYKLLLCVSCVFANVAFAQNSNENTEKEVQKEFENCLDNLEGKIGANGISKDTYKKYTSGLKPNMRLMPQLDKKNQPEFKFSLSQYVAKLVSLERVASGKKLYNENLDLLSKIEQKYGVPGHVVIAVWGVESNYGKNFGKLPLVQSLATLSCNGRRKEFFTKEFFSSLRILQEKHFKEEEFRGSWAGAFGHTQFMPTTFEKIAVDFDKDGKKDLINNIPDALASTANFLKDAGWKRNIPWGVEVEIPSKLKHEGEGRKNKRSAEYWIKAGVKLKNGGELPKNFPDSGLVVEDGLLGGKYLVTKNFDAIYRYNAAESYALAISKLSDILKKNNIEDLNNINLNDSYEENIGIVIMAD